MFAFFQSVVQLPEPLHFAILAGVTLLLGLGMTQLAKAWPWLAEWLGQYVDEAAVAVTAAIVAYLNNLLLQVPANWEAFASLMLQAIVAALVAIGVIHEARKARYAFARRVAREFDNE